MRTLLLIAALMITFSAGCTHVQLQRNTVRQAATLDDIYQQQVLDNLAKFVYDSNSLPHFAFPNQGGASVADSVGGESFIDWMVAGFNSASLKGTGSRQSDLSWTLDPIRDPHKLALMRCAYQKAVANCGDGAPSASCHNCTERFKEFYDGHEHKGDNEACLDGCCWFGWGSKKDVPKGCPCKHVGQYCGVYVWVLPGRGLDELSKLTLTILDFALYSPAPPREKEVVVEYEIKDGKPVAKSVKETYIAPYNEPVTTDSKARVPLRAGPNVKDFSPGGGLLEFELRRRTLVPRSFR